MKKILTFLIASLIASNVWGADKISIRKFGGLNTRTNVFELQDTESPDMSNFTLDEAGTLTRRNLFQRYNSTSVGNISLTNLYKFYTASDAGYMVVSGDNKLYKATGGVISDISVTNNTVESGSSWSFETFTDGNADRVFAANQGTTLQTWNGTNTNFRAETGQATPNTNPSLLKKHKARLWASGSKNYPYRIYYSSLNNGLDWNTSGGSLDLPSYEKIMALEVLSDTLFVFTRNSIYAVLGDTPQEFTIQKTRSSVGTHAYKSVVSGNKLIYFYNKSGIFVFDGDESINISETIQPTIDSISPTYLGNSASLFDKRGRLWFSYTSLNGTFNDTILVYDTVLKQWYPLNDINFNAFFRLDGGTDKGEIFATCSNPVGYLWKLQSGSGFDQIVYSTETQLQTCSTFNTVVTPTPTVELLNGNDYYTKLLAHFNGVDGATTYTTEDTGKRTITFGGGTTAELDTAQKKFGLSSVIYTGAAWTRVPISVDWDFGTGDFTLEAYFRFNVLQNSFIFSTLNPNGWAFYYNNTSKRLELYSSAVASVDSGNNTFTPTIGIWYHLAVVRNGTDIKFYVDGTQIGTTKVAAATYNSWGNLLYIGYDAAIVYMNGWIDEPRISNIARYTSSFVPLAVEFSDACESGTITSLPIQINASGSASLGSIKWQENLPTNTDIQFTTRTGVTSDTIYYNGWQTWVSSNVVTLNTVTDALVWMPLTGATVYFSARKPYIPQPRNVTFYETDDAVSPNCVEFIVAGGALATNKYCDVTVPGVNLTNDKFVGYWLKSPATGNSVQLAIGEVTGVVTAYITANTVFPNVWEFHYWPIANYTSTDIDSIKFMRVTYLGNKTGSLYLGDVSAYDFLDNDETITSAPNDFIQFRGILGTTVLENIPKLISGAGYVIQLSYASTGGASETSLNSYWTSKPFDGQNASLNKLWQIVSVNVESQSPATGHTVYLTYSSDDGRQTGTLSQTIDVTGRTTNIKFYLPTGIYGRSCSFKFEDNSLNDQLKVKNMEVSVIPEGNQ